MASRGTTMIDSFEEYIQVFKLVLYVCLFVLAVVIPLRCMRVELRHMKFLCKDLDFAQHVLR